MQSSKSKVVFKDHNSKQNLLFPPNIGDLIPQNHPVRIVDQIIDQINIGSLLDTYKGGGTSSYDPRMMLKVVIYGYLTNIYTSRKIEQALQQNVHFMWLSGMSYPDHNTINRFRSEKLNGPVREIFNQLVLLLIDQGIVSLKEVFLDGTKIEANANRYSFVWGKSITRSRERIKKQLRELWDYAQKVAACELENNEPDFTEINPEKVEQAIESIDKALKNKKIEPKIRNKITYARKNWPGKLREYDKLSLKMGERNSLSKTDPDATFMRLKEDHMNNSQLKPAYNWQISTQNQFILGYTLHQKPGDTTTLPMHLQELEKNLGQMPENLVADAGYGSEENYQLLEDNKVNAYVKYNHFQKQQTKKFRESPFNIENLHYNPDKDCYYCPIGQQMSFLKEKVPTTDNGYQQTIRIYQAQNCLGCPLRGNCYKGKSNRHIEINPNLIRLRSKAKEKLLSEQGLVYRSRRSVDVEGTFGIIKHNHGFRRFLLRGIDKVNIEAGLLAIAQNIRKMAV
jgi:transposase